MSPIPGYENRSGYAYGIFIDATPAQKSAEAFAFLNERSRRHFPMTEAERKRDDYDHAWAAVLRWREDERSLASHGYLRHYIEGEQP